MSQEKSLVFVQIVFRHGNRTPATTFATDVNRNNSFKPYGPGQLTQKGKQAAYTLGKKFQQMYSAFLGGEYSPTVLQSVTSGVPRAEMSLQCVHAGLFPACQDQQLEDGLAWQPIAYDTFSRRGDKYLGLIAYNNKFLDVYKKLSPEKKELYELIGKHSGETIKNTHAFFRVQNTLQVQEELGYEPPEWTKCISPEEWSEETLNFWEDLATHRVSALGGPLLKLITKNFKDKICGEKGFKERKMCLFSGHDINIVAILGALHSFKREEIHYCSFIALELHQVADEYFVKIIYQNGLEGTQKHLKPMKETEGDLYPLEDFIDDIKWIYQSEETLVKLI